MFPCLSNRGRGAKVDDASWSQADGLTVKGKSDGVFGVMTEQRPCGNRHIRERQELAQHTFVHQVRKLGQVTVALVMHTFDASTLTGIC